MASSTNNYFTKSVLFSYLFILKPSSSFGNHSSTDGLLPFAPKHVVIINKLTTNATLVAHCTNKEKDLGVKEIAPGASFDFKFHVNLRKTTTYTCSFEWPGNKVTFDIFRECIWYIYEPAPCRAKRDGGASICFDWNS
ncbi:hypothetical protein EUTSA_v10009958mg [Eutrema salsugineum]|uniref:S-protein homolog n=1 Tax=Eutrema salsugineum TaxID=72664 RepID=V4L3I8_EUTSA|nr:hypothetical protein EUTSA_v10009958mg [Eutrema salsugineum]